ncbi:hypothetical protein GCM10010250_19690 [Streptomyces althioticus]|nr:hypothetical protein GCM10010250_19690 [Streptomyces althioticus]
MKAAKLPGSDGTAASCRTSARTYAAYAGVVRHSTAPSPPAPRRQRRGGVQHALVGDEPDEQ